MTIEKKVLVNITPEELAKLFCEMTDIEQAIFFNTVSEEAKQWSNNFSFQLQAIACCNKLTSSGRNIMKLIGDYSKIFK